MASRVLNGRYRLDEIIGGGAAATVWRARDRRLDRDVAVKVLDASRLGRHSGERARFRDETRIVARLSHPNIVAVFGSGIENGVAYVVMELVEGRSAAQRLAEGEMPVAEVASVMAQVCDALAIAHAAGVVHRDIKPGNIMLGPGGLVKVCDFGVARLVDPTSFTAAYLAIGPSSYMSPEQVAGRPLDGRADLYSVGGVLFRMLTGIAPFVGESATVRSRRPDIPEDLDRLVGRLLAEDPEGRPATAGEVRRELLRWSESVTADVPRAAGRRRRPFARFGVATMAFAVPAAMLVAWPDQKPAQPPAAPASPAPSASGAASNSASPSASPAKAAISFVAAAPSLQPEPSPAPSPRSMQDQIRDLRALVRHQEAAGQLSPRNADDLDRMLRDLSSFVTQGKQREAHDKLAAIQKKNDDLLAARKISPAGHAAFEDGLDQLAVAIAGMPTA